MTVTTFRDILAKLEPSHLADNELLLEAFLDWASQRGLSIYPAQENAILELFDNKNVILNTPTGSGKSLVASVLHFQSLAQGRRSVYTCPIKALVNEKWMALCKEFGPENVGLSTGDATVNRDAPILCCTAEILANIALSEGIENRIGDVVMDEFHYYSDRDRGVAWQIPLLIMKSTRFLLMSATLGDTEFFERELSQLNGRSTVTVKSQDRPVPLTFSYSEKALPEAVSRMAIEGKAPVYVVHFTQAEAARNAQNFTSIELCTKEEKSAIAVALQGFRFSSPFGPDIKRWLRQGIGLHHAGLLPKYRILVEKLAQQGLLKVICGTDTLGVGVNIPIRTVLFTQLCKYSGEKTAILTVRDFHQISGRAGRKGFDDAGYVVAQAPEHMIENLKLSAKMSQSGKKFVKRKPPEKGYVPWDEGTFRRLIEGIPEKLVSRFQITHGMLLNVLGRPKDGCRAMRNLIIQCHDSVKDKEAHKKRGFQLFRALVEKGIVEVVKPDSLQQDYTEAHPSKVRVNRELQQNFSMDQTLSLYLLETLPFLNLESPDHHLDVLTLVESIIEDPDQVLRRQLDKLKTQRMTELKAQGVEFDQRIAELDAMEYPKPLREFVYGTYNDFSDKHPWVGNENIRPKSIAREMMEGFFTFSNYVKGYALERSEGLLLRYLNSVYKVLANTVPDAAKTDAIREMEVFFGEMIHRVDSSLLEEWERLQNPDYLAVEQIELRPPGADEISESSKFSITTDPVAFLAAIRVRIFSFLASMSRSEYSSALESLAEGLEDLLGATTGYGSGWALMDAEGAPWTEDRFREKMASYRPGHGMFRLDPEGRALRYTLVEKNLGSADGQISVWEIKQMLQDHEGHNDWAIEFSVDLAESSLAGVPVLRLLRMGEMEP
jgi:superfamily II RNA helicase